jgi:hypothetical protein
MQHEFLGPGMTGPRVAEVQQLIGVRVTGTYDEETTLKVRGLQVIHDLPLRDGVFDDELRSKLVRASG